MRKDFIVISRGDLFFSLITGFPAAKFGGSCPFAEAAFRCRAMGFNIVQTLP